MELPSVRELELETLLREKDVQLAEMTDEIVWLRQYVAKQPGPSTTEPLTLPPAFVSVLLPHINNAANSSSINTSTTNNTGASTSGSSSTVTAALTQRVKLLQTENDELYDLLKTGETGKLKDEVRGLRRVVAKLEGALKESHQVMKTLSIELDKANETIKNTSRPLESTTNHKSNSHSNSYSPRNSYNTSPHFNDSGSHGETSNNSRTFLPTEPRAHKRPRLSEAPAQEQQPSPTLPPPRLAPSLPQKPQTHHHVHHNTHHNTNNPHRHNVPPSRLADGRHHSNINDNRTSNNGHNNNNTTKGIVKMEVDDAIQRVPSPAQRDPPNNRDRSTNSNSNRDHRDRRERERDSGVGGKERDRARDTAGAGTKDWNDRNAVNNRNLNNNGHLPSNPRRTNGHIAGTSIRGAANNPLLNSNNPGRRGTNDRSANNSGSSHHHHHHTNNNTNTSDQGSRTLQERLGL